MSDCNRCGHVYLKEENVFQHDCSNPRTCDHATLEPATILHEQVVVAWVCLDCGHVEPAEWIEHVRRMQ